MEYFIKAPVHCSFLNLWMFRINKWSQLRKNSRNINCLNLTYSVNYDKIVQTITGIKKNQKLTNISTWGGFLVAYASSSVRGSNNKLSTVVKGPDAIICFSTKSMCKLSRGIKRLREILKRCHHSIH